MPRPLCAPKLSAAQLEHLERWRAAFVLQRGATVLGHRLEYDEPAATDAWQRVRAFLATTLADR